MTIAVRFLLIGIVLVSSLIANSTASARISVLKKPHHSDLATSADTAPTINFSQPSSNVSVAQGASVLIQWTDSDPDDNAYITIGHIAQEQAESLCRNNRGQRQIRITAAGREKPYCTLCETLDSQVPLVT
jgi:hypothetical protein